MGVRGLQTDVALGIERELEAAPVNIDARRPPSAEMLARRPPSFRLDRGRLQATPAPISTFECKPPGSFDFPDTAAGIGPEGRPVPGIYLWMRDLEAETPDFGWRSIEGLRDDRVIHNVRDHGGLPDAYRYEQVQALLPTDARATFGDFGMVHTTYLVVPRSPAQTTQTQSDVGAGFYLESIEFKLGEETRASFHPQPPVELLRFPIVMGQEIDSTGVDPTTLSQLTVRGQLNEKRHIEGCGERIDSWYVEGEQRFTVTDPETLRSEEIRARYEYAVAPQLGTLIVGEHIEVPLSEPIAKATFRMGSIEPIERIEE